MAVRFWKGKTALGTKTWTNAMIEQLLILSGEGHSMAEIGRRLHVSASAVGGKRKRLGLSDPANSPIKASSPRRSPSLPPLPQLAPSPVRIAVRPTITAPVRPTQVVKIYAPVKMCCWPLGEPKTPSFAYCDAPTSPGKPYCQEHYDLAVIKTPKAA